MTWTLVRLACGAYSVIVAVESSSAVYMSSGGLSLMLGQGMDSNFLLYSNQFVERLVSLVMGQTGSGSKLKKTMVEEWLDN